MVVIRDIFQLKKDILELLPSRHVTASDRYDLKSPHFYHPLRTPLLSLMKHTLGGELDLNSNCIDEKVQHVTYFHHI